MGILSRLQRVTVAHIESLLKTVEDPELVFPQLVIEMEERLRAATETEAQAMAAVKKAERELADLKTRIDRLRKGAELAMGKGDEDTARDALAAQIDSEGQLALREEALARSQLALDHAREARKQIQPQLDEMRQKKDEILARARVVKNQQKVMKTVHGSASSSRSILDEASRMESLLEEKEAEVSVRSEIVGAGKGPSLDARLKDLERSSSVEDRLAALKAKRKGTSSP